MFRSLFSWMLPIGAGFSRWLRGSELGFDPCSPGCSPSASWRLRRWPDSARVSILVLLDAAHRRRCSASGVMRSGRSFDPCSPGCTPIGLLASYGRSNAVTEVSILVLLDALRPLSCRNLLSVRQFETVFVRPFMSFLPTAALARWLFRPSSQLLRLKLVLAYVGACLIGCRYFGSSNRGSGPSRWSPGEDAGLDHLQNLRQEFGAPPCSLPQCVPVRRSVFGPT